VRTTSTESVSNVGGDVGGDEGGSWLRMSAFNGASSAGITPGRSLALAAFWICVAV
jgi:hypothetical protein